jgi:hypothetical protein
MQRPLSRDDILKIRTEVFFDFNQPGQLSPVYKAVLQPVKFYAPLDAYYQLYDALKRIAEFGFEKGESEETAATLYEELKKHFLSKECWQEYGSKFEDDYLWARVIIILTMEIFAKAVGGGDIQEIKKTYVPGFSEEHSEAVLTEVQHLYNLAKTTPPGGAAFHFIASVLLLLRTLDSQYMRIITYKSLDHYLDLTQRLNWPEFYDTSYNAFKNLSPGQDHCLSYLRNKWLDRSAPLRLDDSRIMPYHFKYPGVSEKPNVSWWHWRKKSGEVPVAAKPDKVKSITAVMVGPSGAGKTTLVRQLVKANQQAVELGVGLQIRYDPSKEMSLKILEQATPPGTQEMLLLQGVLLPEESHGRPRQRDNRQNNEATRAIFNIFDSKGGSMFSDPPPLGGEKEEAVFRHDMTEGEKLYLVTASADLLVLFIPPESFVQYPYLSTLSWETLVTYFPNFVTQVSQNNNAMIAIAYTKCDEYGVRLSRTRRIIEEEATHTALERYRDAENPREASWQVFVAEAAKRGEGGEAELVKNLLNMTATLWKTTLRNSKHRFLNGYLVSAEPALDSLGNGSFEVARNWESLGLLQIFIDFFAHLKTIKAI